MSSQMWSSCVAAFDTPKATFAQNAPQDKAILNALGQFFLHNFVTIHVCDKNTLQPVGTTPTDEGHCTKDPVTHKCWSLPPCYIDPNSGQCTNSCVSSTGAGCQPVPLPRFCDPSPVHRRAVVQLYVPHQSAHRPVHLI